jgi:hypothetical protein
MRSWPVSLTSRPGSFSFPLFSVGGCPKKKRGLLAHLCLLDINAQHLHPRLRPRLHIYPHHHPHLHQTRTSNLSYLSNFVTAGKTYPQEGPVTLETFLSYFFGATCILGIVSSSPSSSSTSEEESKSLEDPNKDSPSEEMTVENAVGGRGWEECLVGCYYM